MNNELGFLNVNKPAGWTSHDCVAKIRRILKIKRVGHGGTLDPAATGVLPVAIGKATRLLQFLPTQKAYLARIRFGVQTTTDDLEGDILRTHSANTLTLAQVQPFLGQFLGTIAQIPPAYSAIHQGGKRLYELARKGEIIEVPSRQVEIYHLEPLRWYEGEFPELEISIICGPGTYIRSLARDLGNCLNVGATLAALTRTESCGLQLSQSLSLEEIETRHQQGNLGLISPPEILNFLPRITLSPSDAQHWCQGQKVTFSELTENLKPSPIQVFDENEQFLGLGEVVTCPLSGDRDNLLIPKIVLY